MLYQPHDDTCTGVSYHDRYSEILNVHPTELVLPSEEIDNEQKSTYTSTVRMLVEWSANFEGIDMSLLVHEEILECEV